MAAAQQARDSLALLDYDEAEFMMEHQAEIAGLLTGASQSMGVGKDVLEQGLRQVRATLLEVDQLHKQQFAKFGHLNSPEFFASRQKLLRQLLCSFGAYGRLACGIALAVGGFVVGRRLGVQPARLLERSMYEWTSP